MSEPQRQPNGQTDRRRVTRTAFRLNATMRDGTRTKAQVRIIDISTHGCRIECSSGANADSWVWLNIAGLETQYCRIAWRAGEFAGLAFATPLAEAVLERLLQQEEMTETSIGQLRDIAARTHFLARKSADADVQALAELSKDCAVGAVVEGFRLSETKRRRAAPRA